MRGGPLAIDGGPGEGGGQILRTAASLAAISGRTVRIVDVRKGRPRPGLAAQHVTAVRAVGAGCDARIVGGALGLTELLFEPGGPPKAGAYAFDVAAARPGGSAGAVTLVLQAVLPPLARAAGPSTIDIRGGTFLPWSPPADDVTVVWFPLLRRMGVEAELAQMRAGWFPAGGGRIEAKVAGTGRDALLPVDVRERGPLVRVDGTVPLLRLPVRIGHRLADRALAGLAGLDVPVVVDVAALEETSAGVGLFLAARYDGVTAGFSAIGARGKPAEAVADEAVRALLDHHAVGAALDVHQSGQCLLSMALAPGPSRFSVARLSRHFETNRAVIERFGIAHVTIDERPGGGHDVRGEGGLDADQHRREAAARAFSKRGGGA